MTPTQHRARAFFVTVIVASLAVTGCVTDDGPGSGLQPAGGDVLRSEETRELSPSIDDDAQQALVDGNTAFALDLYQVIADEEDGNLFCSPFSISIALAMTYAGARGETATEMAEALHFSLIDTELHPAFNWLDLELESRGEGAEGMDDEPFRLHVTNALWGQLDYPFLSDFVDLLGVNYGAGMRLLDFVSASEDSRLTINDWVADQTEGRILDLIPQGGVSGATRLVLTNAIYFNAAWASKFDESQSREGEFLLADGSPVTTTLMSQAGSYPYASGDGYQAIELPYDGDELSMVIILPEAGTFEAFEDSLTAGTLDAAVADLTSARVRVTMPRFSFESGFSLADALQALGMQQAFSPAADFGGISERRDLMITDVFHKAFVAVDESGTEAAAATAVVMGETSAEPPPLELTANRPFIFLIRDMETGTVLFLGRVMTPAE